MSPRTHQTEIKVIQTAIFCQKNPIPNYKQEYQTKSFMETIIWTFMFLSMVTENSRMKIRSECLVNVCELTKKSRYLHKISRSVSAY